MLALIVKGNQAGMLDKGSNGSTEAHALRAAPTATLSHRAVTHEAQALVSAVYDTITANELARGTRKKARQTNAHIFRRAVEGFLGDLGRRKYRQPERYPCSLPGPPQLAASSINTASQNMFLNIFFVHLSTDAPGAAAELTADDFTAGPVGYRYFRDLVEGLKHAGLVESKPGLATNYRAS